MCKYEGYQEHKLMTFATIRFARSLSRITGIHSKPSCNSGTRKHEIFVPIITFFLFHHAGLNAQDEENKTMLLKGQSASIRFISIQINLPVEEQKALHVEKKVL